ncbi:saccharopine dehydrogenase NADP-binding domain-containing protein [Mycolicibacterium sp. S2-37]|uniref:saccharopine dehydrogenase family protein n=1 Tax=Mycolicibacterium sp. S2-37 TaxID=2810297 RepID=UPI001A94AB35|nr:saccharopine dehydrogenase NADP-binding domain-containing protein [Mycolicibacterium sp. S2-37]MBO0678802.1 saccharopine dehydrogenase NADP-binding domain-containing protein [Mycolicibacterium sp. S2-37]
MPTLMIYGATGYTGRLTAEHAAAAGLDLVLGGRDNTRLAALAHELGAGHRTFDLGDDEAIDVALSDIAVVLNCAGPFMQTAKPLIGAAIRSQTHYLDVAAELDSYYLAEELDPSARDAGVMLLPGSGGSVAMLGCLAAHAAQRVTDPRSVRIALHVAGSMSRGSAISAGENLTTDCLERLDGQLVSRNPDDRRDFDFGWGLISCSATTLPDLVTIWQATGIRHIETFVHVSGYAFPDGDLAALPDGPSADERRANRYHAAVEVSGADGAVARSVLDTVNGYTFTPLAATEAARRVLSGEHRPGFHTPAALFGTSFAETIADTRITDL